MTGAPPPPGSPAELAHFAELQSRLEATFLRFHADNRQAYTVLVVPSTSFDATELAKIEGVAHYEERSLFKLMLLRHPRLRVVYVTSKRLDPLIVDYYLHQMRGVPPQHARRRLTLLDCDDASPRPLTEKILERPHLLQRIADAIEDPSMAHLGVFNSSDAERTLATRLNIPMFACDPALVDIGNKSGSRRAFKEAGVLVSPGQEDLRDRADIVGAIEALALEHPTASRVVIKLNDGFSGEGNAVLRLSDAMRDASASVRKAAIVDALPGVLFEDRTLTWPAFEEQFERMQGICELWLDAEHVTSPSVQVRVNPTSQVHVLSTHDQILGGSGGQVFQGATFPARADYRVALQDAGRRVGHALAERGVIGRFGVDFVVTETAGEQKIYALEVNLREGGTTHPFNTLKFLTDGTFDEETGRFFTAQGRERTYFATDNLASESYRGIMPFDLIDEMVLFGRHFKANETGVVFHLLGCLSEFGKLGCTAIGANLDEARAVYDDAVALLADLSRHQGLERYKVPPRRIASGHQTSED